MCTLPDSKRFGTGERLPTIKNSLENLNIRTDPNPNQFQSWPILTMTYPRNKMYRMIFWMQNCRTVRFRSLNQFWIRPLRYPTFPAFNTVDMDMVAGTALPFAIEAYNPHAYWPLKTWNGARIHSHIKVFKNMNFGFGRIFKGLAIALKTSARFGQTLLTLE